MTRAEDKKIVQAQRRMRIWAIALAAALLVVLGSVIALAIVASRETARADGYGTVLYAQNGVITPLCEVAGPSVAGADVQAQQACENVSKGLPPVPLPEGVDPPVDSDDGVGIAYTRQVDRCFVEVGLSDGQSSRFGPFCGSPGATGPTGPAGPSGAPGHDGSDGSAAVGISAIETDGCMVNVVMTDSSTRAVGPFCGSPLGEYTEVRPDGSEKHCRRDGGEDTAPRYVCAITSPTTTTPPTETTDELLPTPSR